MPSLIIPTKQPPTWVSIRTVSHPPRRVRARGLQAMVGCRSHAEECRPRVLTRRGAEDADRQTKSHAPTKGMLTVGCLMLLLGCFSARAQFVPGQGFAGFGQQGANQNRSTMSYPNASDVGNAIISLAPDSRSLIVIADEKTRAQISQVVSNLDRPRPQVLIKVVFLEVTHSDNTDIGFEGGYVGTNSETRTALALANAFGLSSLALPATGSNASPLNALGQPTSAFVPTPPGAGLYQVLAADYQFTLRAIAQYGKTKVLSRPSVLARNNQPATISVGQLVPIINGTTTAGTTGNVINTYTYNSVGIILRVTPFITPDGLVEMILQPETSELVADRSQWVTISPGVSAPLIDSRSADTVVVTPDGQTVIIGGLVGSSKGVSESKIPLLGDIPWIGNLFKHRITTDAKTELIIFLTPYIVQAPTELAALSATEQQKSSGMKAFTEKELNEFLDNLPKPPNKSKKK